jgi:hypothetical protein
LAGVPSAPITANRSERDCAVTTGGRHHEIFLAQSDNAPRGRHHSHSDRVYPRLDLSDLDHAERVASEVLPQLS